MIEKRVVRWRPISDYGDWSCWEVNGKRLIVNDPKRERKGKKAKLLDDRILSILEMNPRKRRTKS